MAEFFLQIVNMSISATWLVLAVLVLRLVLKKAPKWMTVLLWGFAAVRLICPFSLESVLSLIPSAQTISPEIMLDPMPTIQSGIPVINEAVNPIISQGFAPAPEASANPLQIWIPVISCIWIIGIVLMLGCAVLSYWRLRRRVSSAVLLRDNVFQSERVISPFVLGILRPRIYLPFYMSKQDMAYVLAHEYAHIRRRDHWWKPLGYLLLILHWFNPVMWLGYVLLCRDIELACDEKVIKKLGTGQRADYSQALLTCSVNRRMIAVCPLAFGEVDVKARVKSVLNYKKPAFWVILAAIMACITVVVCFLTNPKEKDADFYNEKLLAVKCANYSGMGDLESMFWNYYEIEPSNGALLPGHAVNFTITEINSKSITISFDNELEHWLGGSNRESVTAVSVEPGKTVSVYPPIDGGGTTYTFYIVEDHTAQSESEVLCWYEYPYKPSAESGGVTAELPQIPGVTFSLLQDKVSVTKDGATIAVFAGVPIRNAYFMDLTGDGMPELCVTRVSNAGIGDTHVMAYDLASAKTYALWERGQFDYTLSMRKDQLFVTRMEHTMQQPDGTVEEGYLAMEKDPQTGELRLCMSQTPPVNLPKPDENSSDNPETTEPAKTEPRLLTLNDVIALSKKSTDLSKDDLEGFMNREIGSGMYILRYDIDGYFWLRVYPDPLGDPLSVFLHAGSSEICIDIRTEDVEQFISKYQNDKLEAAISAAIKSHYVGESDQPTGLISAEAHAVLGKEIITADGANGEQYKETIVYLLTLYKEYSMYPEKLTELLESYVPAVLTFSVNDSGEYIIQEYWEPRDGSFFKDDIHTQFDSYARGVWERAEYKQALDQQCYADAAAILGM